MIHKFVSKSFIIEIMKKVYCNKGIGNLFNLISCRTNSAQNNFGDFHSPSVISDTQCISKLVSDQFVELPKLLNSVNRKKFLLKYHHVCGGTLFNYMNCLSNNFVVLIRSEGKNISCHYFLLKKWCLVLCFMYYFLRSEVLASDKSDETQFLEENFDCGKVEFQNLSSQDCNQKWNEVQNEYSESNQGFLHQSSKSNPNLAFEKGEKDDCNANHADHVTNSEEDDTVSTSHHTDEPSVFAPMALDELQVSTPAELNDAQSLTHLHLVRQSAAVAVESSLLLLLRVSRAHLVIMENYKSELEHILQLLQYNATLLRNCGGSAEHSQALQQITDALTAARAREQRWEQQYKDGCLLMRVAHQSSDSAQLCAHIAGAEQDALAVAAAVAALRPKVEQLQREIRSLRRDVQAQHVEVIRSEQEGRQNARPPADDAA